MTERNHASIRSFRLNLPAHDELKQAMIDEIQADCNRRDDLEFHDIVDVSGVSVANIVSMSTSGLQSYIEDELQPGVNQVRYTILPDEKTVPTAICNTLQNQFGFQDNLALSRTGQSAMEAQKVTVEASTPLEARSLGSLIENNVMQLRGEKGRIETNLDPDQSIIRTDDPKTGIVSHHHIDQLESNPNQSETTVSMGQ